MYQARLEALLGVSCAGAMTSQIGEVRPASARPAADVGVDAGLLAEAGRIKALIEQREGAARPSPPVRAAKTVRATGGSRKTKAVPPRPA